MPAKDEDILKGLLNGDIKAFERIYHQYFRLLCYEARGYIPDHSIIEELVNDVFTRVWKNSRSLPGDLSIRSYLVKSVHNACISYLRHRKTMNAMYQVTEDKDIMSQTLYSLGEDPLDYMISRETEENIEKAISRLAPQYQKAFRLSRYHDFSYSDIAEHMNISVNTVKTYMKNALSQLRDMLKNTLLMLFFLS